MASLNKFYKPKSSKKKVSESAKKQTQPKNTKIKEIPTTTTTNGESLKFIDLFCGIGGFHQALAKLGGKCVLACDIDKHCRRVYKKNYGIEPVSDVRKINEKEMVDFDVICGGFPCQPFSNGGNKKSFDDERGLLFDEIMRIAKHKKPRFMFLENVKHILKVSNGEVLKYIKQKIDEHGYVLQICRMSPHIYGIPQQRERVFFICVRKDIYNGKEINVTAPNLNMKITDIAEKKPNPKYKIGDIVKRVLDAWDELIKQFKEGTKLSPTILIHDYFRNYTQAQKAGLPKWKQDYMAKNIPLITKYINIIRPWYEKYKEVLSIREIYGKLEWQTGPLKKNDSIYKHFIQLRQSGIRVKKPHYFPTLVAISQIPIYGKKKRYITPRECARLQSFPESFQLDESDRVTYKQMGNSVNVYNVHTVISSTLKHYNIVE
jgi:DNA (cytosine-5)-methyltransferase 1